MREGRSTWKIWTALLSCLFFGIVLVLVFYVHKFWRKSEAQKETIRLLKPQEIAEFKFGRTPLQNGTDIGSGAASDGKEHAMYLRYDEDLYEVDEEDLILGK